MSKISKKLIEVKVFLTLCRFWKWTGIPDKKGWDFIQLGISASLPIMLLLATNHFSTQNNQQDALIKYLEQMSQLLLHNKLREGESEARIIARARTLSTLTNLNSIRKGLLINFLAEAKLIEKDNPIIPLKEADLKRANFRGFTLKRYNFKGASLNKANFSQAVLNEANLNAAVFIKANLSGAYLIRADLSGANLKGTNLKGADLSKADLSEADLSGANLKRADLSGANLKGADFTNATYLKPEQITSACYWQDAILDKDLRKKLDKELKQ